MKFNFNTCSVQLLLVVALPALSIAQIHRSEADSLKKTMDTLVNQLETVQVSGRKPLTERKNGTLVLNVAGSSLSAGSTALGILQRAPGVSIDQEGHISLNGKGGVTVMLNGKPTYLSAGQLADLLRNTAGNTIMRMELMSVPPAKYEAAGTGGIINIVLKKNTAYGTNGTFTTSGGYGRGEKAGTGITLNHRTKKINLFGDYAYDSNQQVQYLNVRRSSRSGQDTTWFNQVSVNRETRNNHSYKAGADYEFNEKHTLGFVFSGYDHSNRMTGDNQTLITHRPLLTDTTLLAANPGRATDHSRAYNLNYKFVPDTTGREFSIDLDEARFSSNSSTQYNNYFFSAAAPEQPAALIFRNETPSRIRIRSMKADGVLPLSSRFKLESGLKFSEVQTDNDFRQAILNGDSWENDPGSSNRFSYREQLYAAYSTLHSSWKDFTVQLGLRAELSRTAGNSVTLQQLVRRKYTDLFPVLMLNRSLAKGHDLGFSYSRRTDRPDYQALNPFRYFSDLYTYNQGNPYLSPQYAGTLELRYSYRKKTNVSLSYTHTRDVITTNLIADTLHKTLILQDQNLASRKTYSLNAGRSLSAGSWWSSTVESNLYYSRFQSPDLMAAPFSSGKLTWMISTQQQFVLSPTISAELSGSYISRQALGTVFTRPYYGADLGLSKSFAQQKASLKLTVADLFNTRRISVSSAFPQMDYRLNQKDESRIVRAVFTYRFGSSTVRGSRDRSGGAAAEQGRVRTAH